MFFKNFVIPLSLKFLWVGLIFGVFFGFCDIIKKMAKRNLYVVNIVDFCFWLAFLFVFARMSFVLYDYEICWFGLASMLLGLILVKISVNFFFTKFAKLVYNGLTDLKRRKHRYGKLQTNEKS